jgi:hypothetical protein
LRQGDAFGILLRPSGVGKGATPHPGLEER